LEKELFGCKATPRLLNKQKYTHTRFCLSITRHVWENVAQVPLALRSRSSSEYLRIQSVPQREHHISPLQRSTG
jgi:hypothetical protein